MLPTFPAASAHLKEHAMIDPAYLAKLVEQYKARPVEQADVTPLDDRHDHDREQIRAA
jgi:hypothetical protein